jgi:GT2 family glycosyltransferase/predicted O-methyltransferase YrrM
MISIIMPVHNQIEFTKKAIESLYEFTDPKDFNLLVINNASTDGTQAYLVDFWKGVPNLQTIWNLKNLGWVKALNQGFKWLGNSDFVLWANNDVVFEKDWLPKMLAHFRPGVGAMGPTSNYVNGRQRYELGRGEWEEEVNWLIGFFLMFRKGVIDALGDVDERFEMGGSEEWDYLIRMQKTLGLKCVIARDVFIHHFGSKTIMSVLCKTTEDYSNYSKKMHEILKNKWGEEFIASWINQKITISQKPENLPWPVNCKLGRAIPHTWSHIEYQTALSLEGMRKPNTIILETGRGGEIDTKRERQVESGMAQGCTHFFIGDGDMVYPPNILIDLFKILNDGADIAGGLCYRGYPPYDPIAWHPTEDRMLFPFIDYKFGDVIEASATGAACLLVKREVFEKLPQPWFQRRYKKETEDEKDYREGEDHYFTKKATQAGFSLRIHTKHDVDHLREFPINRQLWLTHGLLSRCDDWGTITSLFKKLGDKKWIDRELRGADVEIDWQINQKPYEIGLLYRFLEGKKLHNILEIGTQRGGTALLWAKLVEPRNGRVYCVDRTFDEEAVYKNHVLRPFITEIQGDSHNKETLDRVINTISNNGGSVDFLFIDGDHSYEGVKADFENYFPFVRAGGWIGFHDILASEWNVENACLVMKFWNELKPLFNHFEITDPNDKTWMGIGVLQKPL